MTASEMQLCVVYISVLMLLVTFSAVLPNPFSGVGSSVCFETGKFCNLDSECCTNDCQPDLWTGDKRCRFISTGRRCRSDQTRCRKSDDCCSSYCKFSTPTSRIGVCERPSQP